MEIIKLMFYKKEKIYIFIMKFLKIDVIIFANTRKLVRFD